VVPSFGVERSAALRSCPSARPGEGRVKCARDRQGCEQAGPLSGPARRAIPVGL
jgi:hypothetical protein